MLAQSITMRRVYRSDNQQTQLLLPRLRRPSKWELQSASFRMILRPGSVAYPPRAPSSNLCLSVHSSAHSSSLCLPVSLLLSLCVSLSLSLAVSSPYPPLLALLPRRTMADRNDGSRTNGCIYFSPIDSDNIRRMSDASSRLLPKTEFFDGGAMRASKLPTGGFSATYA